MPYISADKRNWPIAFTLEGCKFWSDGMENTKDGTVTYWSNDTDVRLKLTKSEVVEINAS